MQTSIIEGYFKIEEVFNNSKRSFLASIKQDGANWEAYKGHENSINKYYYSVRNLIKAYKVSWIELLESESSEARRAALNLIKDGFCDLSSENHLLKKLINISIVGNDEEKTLARDIITLRGWVKNKISLVREEIDYINSNKVHYFYDGDTTANYCLYKDIGETLLLSGCLDLLRLHINQGLQDKDAEVVSLANDFLCFSRVAE